ncbi:3-hydroxyacyl-ACP dehydratase FabZ [Candidatus Moduliflexota bacterium]
MTMDIRKILDSLPHRYPFLLIDRVIEMEKGTRLVALKNVTVNEEFFNGHFPGFPVMPGVLIVEALAQAGGILALQDLGGELGSRKIFFMSIEKARFRKPVVPGDQLRLEVGIERRRSTIWKMDGKAFVGDTLVTDALLQAMITE